MILPASNSSQRISSEEIAELTIKCLINSVPSEVPGIAIFVGEDKLKWKLQKNLDAINKRNHCRVYNDIFHTEGHYNKVHLKHWTKNY